LDGHAPTPFAERLRRGDTLIGTVVTLPSVPLAELLAEPLDLVWIDLEHGALDAADVPALAVAARAAGAAALARLPCADAPALAAVLDSGVDGVVAPQVESAAQARRLVERLRHPPRGTRGFAARRAQGYGRAGGAPDPLCLVQIESAAGLEAVEEIAAVDGVDALVVGCADLALAVGGAGGAVGGAGGADLRAAIARVQDAAADHGLRSGIAGPDDAELLLELAGGRSTMLVCSADVRIYARAVDEAVAALRVREGLRVGA
jgi:4-hydroxy-2-oxoheptanedioate aldolase